VLGFATNALNFDSSFSLETLGGLKMPRPSYAIFASRFRAGCKTVHDCDLLLAKLRTLKEDNLPAWSAFKDNFTPGWDSPPFCLNICEAQEGRGLTLKSPEFTAATHSMSTSYRNKPFGRLQGKYVDLIRSHCLSSSDHWHTLLVRRIGDFGYDITVSQASIYIENVCTALKAIPAQKRIGVAMMYIKTMTNSWFTSRRLANAGVPKLNCIFGCEDCADDLSHYLQCQIIWVLVCSAMKLDNTWASLDGIDRVGFPDPDPIHLFTVCVMFKCYHAIRNDYATILDGCIAHNDFSEIHSKTIFLARLFASDFLC
jgi:hypothetical protein